MDLLKLLGIAGGGVGIVASVILLFAIPSICEPGSSPDVLVGFDCLNLGVHTQVQWALVLGGACGGAAALLTAVFKGDRPG